METQSSISDIVDRLARMQARAPIDPQEHEVALAARGMNYEDPYSSRDRIAAMFDPVGRTLDRTYFELFRRSSWVRACVERIAAEVPKRQFRVLYGGDENHQKARATRKWLNRVGGDVSIEFLTRELMRDVLVYGKGFLAVLRDADLPTLYRLDARLTDPIISETNELEGFMQSWMGKTVWFPKEEVIYFYIGGAGPYMPLSPLFTLLIPGSTDVAADKFNLAFHRNATNVGMVFSSTAPKAVVDRNRDYLRDKYAKPENAFLPLIIEGDSQLVRDGTSVVKDMSWSDLTTQVRNKVCAIYQTPASELGISEDVNRNVMAGMHAAWLENTVWPWQEAVCALHTQRLFWDMLGDDELELAPPSRVQYIPREAADVSAALARRGATINEIRAVTQHPPIEGGEQLVLYIDGFGYVPLDLPIAARLPDRRKGMPDSEMDEDDVGGRPDGDDDDEQENYGASRVRQKRTPRWRRLDHDVLGGVSGALEENYDVPDWHISDEDLERVIEQLQEDPILSSALDLGSQ